MSAPRRVQRTRKAGGGMPVGAVYVGRPGRWGNPFEVRRYGVRLSLQLFRSSLAGMWDPGNVAGLPESIARDAYEAHVAWLKRLGGHPTELAWAELAGRDLACWCAPGAPCHADALLEVANGSTTT